MGISFEVDSGPLRHVVVFVTNSSLQIDCGHNVKERKTDFNQMAKVLRNWD